ncbi:MAG: 4-hydroxy-3-methylbut-2-enyl diphosphate reductase [Alphaproteobacteria bacterium RIFCSPLOWO2_01_FULL_40_26]|nr:MAG: 4-hydroxy-3-methylbut-2-enyl diphosphate reductase [Alphaproteobacteria bacterium RIFCSPHIGHO2_02_FULL_40_34]OFW88089.1 MAG: 4-hydroxy-3-methylbut-2-enyl diphosphate reductase [Alphaproteobacteria bacterium RIFCSPHIGHO2_01_FULL_40_8]OFW94242.1 MAG: 4-hydroxy-3-methylbut-2-enyl diphosphate reductase [Alphaproteobacteria bacterium RIFCSPLOWO2_01_FULL_40_26]OFX09811.1 MAG: 4-hydroxy-3-methylbut-2-enyl diphosphate reductase [Alphaproteobacteria bacterium RIFCSPLOWO2_02_FULL_40_19]OFX12248.1
MNIILAKPRGFCAGVTRAIETVEKALAKFGAPVYVRHEIVHNKFVVESLRKKGAIFVNEVDEIPQGAITIFSAHGVSNRVEEDAILRGLDVIDATCPLVSKVHREAKKYEEEDYEIILIGHRGHPEVEGTSGRVKKEVILVTSEDDARNVIIKNPDKISYVTQTTLSVDDTRKIVEILEQRFPKMQQGLATKDICYATQNRQDAVRFLAKIVDILLVIGAKNSSNSNRLRDLGEESGLPSYLINGAQDVNIKWLENVKNIGLTAGASAPEILVQEVIEKIGEIAGNEIQVSDMNGISENVFFALPRRVRK